MVDLRALRSRMAIGFAASLALAAAVLMGYLIAEVDQVKGQRTDLAELRDVKYGLLDADAWVERVSAILGHKIEAFELTESNRPQIREDVALVLDRLILEIDDHLRQRNQEGPLHKRVTGALRQMVQDALVDVGELRERVPVYADAILDELGKPEPKRKVQDQVAAMLRDMAGTTFARTDRSVLEGVLARHGCSLVTDCEARLAEASAAGQDRAVSLTLAVAGLVGGLFAFCLSRSRRVTLARMAVMTLAGVILLAGGLLTPMIEIDARIAELSFQLLGEPVVFRDQVLYFQSKSIFDVVAILARSGGADMVLVAFLVVLFSVCFPLLKVVAGFVYLADWRGLRRSGLVRFFALKSGKWSMADVLVIAIFMAYVGFSGLVTSQLQGIAGVGAAVDILTTNGTALQPGFYLFLGFVLASLVLSHLLANSVEAECASPAVT
jgi:Paraquat-inducible protein A